VTDEERDRALREMARVRGFRLVKSRRRKRGGDRGKFGLADAATGKELLGFGDKGFEATAEDVEAFLRDQAGVAWTRSVRGRKTPVKTSRSP